MEENYAWHPAQHGGIPKHNTDTAQIDMRNFVMTNEENKAVTGILIVDQREAFDVINHETLKAKLKIYNWSE